MREDRSHKYRFFDLFFTVSAFSCSLSVPMSAVAAKKKAAAMGEPEAASSSASSLASAAAGILNLVLSHLFVFF